LASAWRQAAALWLAPGVCNFTRLDWTSRPGAGRPMTIVDPIRTGTGGTTRGVLKLYQGGDVKRWWGIRHLRYWWHVAGLNLHLARWEAMGFVPIPQQSDLDHLQAIWEGRA
jgi:hypothetical protein